MRPMKMDRSPHDFQINILNENPRRPIHFLKELSLKRQIYFLGKCIHNSSPQVNIFKSFQEDRFISLDMFPYDIQGQHLVFSGLPWRWCFLPKSLVEISFCVIENHLEFCNESFESNLWKLVHFVLQKVFREGGLVKRWSCCIKLMMHNVLSHGFQRGDGQMRCVSRTIGQVVTWTWHPICFLMHLHP
jgi:hypothetical protein